MSGYYLGLDGGGTKTAACILDSERNELGRGHGGPCNIATGTPESLRESVLSATRLALESAGLPPDTRFESVCTGVAGYTAKRRRAEFLTLLRDTIPATRHRLEPDFVIAYWGATAGEPGVIVIAGTGAVAYGRNAAGESYRWDGKGFLLGDRGSGFDLVRGTLRSLMHVLARGGDLKPLDQMLMEAMGAEDADDVVEWVYREFSPARVSSLAEVIGNAALRGDAGARMAIAAAGISLRMTFDRVRRKLGMADTTPAYCLGGLWKTGECLVQGFHRGFDQAPPPPVIELKSPLHDAAFGAALLAMQDSADG